MTERIKNAIDLFNSSDDKTKEELLDKFMMISNTYWFIKDCLEKSDSKEELEISEDLVDEYEPSYAEEYMRNILIHGLGMSYNEAEQIMDNGREELDVQR